MAQNHLEQLVCEWYEFQGYFVRRNVLVGKRASGGHETELDVVAFHPTTRHLVHLEPSLDTHSWELREKRYKKKFEAGQKHIPLLFANMGIPEEIEQVAVFLYGSGSSHPTVGGGKVVMVSHLLCEISVAMEERNISKNIVPEQFPLLRTIMFVSQFRDDISSAISKSKLST